MLVYQHRERTVSPHRLLHQLCNDAGVAVRLAQPPADALVDLLIRAGELETSVLDALCPHVDDEKPEAWPLRAMTASAARALLAAGAADFADASRALATLGATAAALDPALLPRSAPQQTAEGYALYGVHPEAYAKAAVRFFAQLAPMRVCAIGIRSIGTSLSAAVAAALCRRGAAVRTVALRPRGEPWDRVVRATDRFTRTVVGNADEYFAIVDEGPGMSGSTAAAVVAWLRRSGVAASRIVLFASHPVDPASLSSVAAREVWTHTRTYVAASNRLPAAPLLSGASFAEAPDDHGSTPRSGVDAPVANAMRPPAWRAAAARASNSSRLIEISAGAWRPLLLRGRPFPAVHPRHERRKFIAGADAPSNGRARIVARFAGLGHYGRAAGARACALADAGFTPPVHGCSGGFLQLEFVRGRIASPPDLSAALLDTMAAYAAHLRRNLPAAEEPSPVSLPQMLLHNASEGLAGVDVGRLERAVGRLLSFDPVETVAIDGRMLPQEWIVTGPGRFVKVDAFDHHRDDFFPGPTDIAWDLAGAAVEWGLSRSTERYLVERYARLARDPGVDRRMPFFRLAYTAWRLGYASLAAHSLGTSADSRRFAALVPWYAARLRTELGAASNGWYDGR